MKRYTEMQVIFFPGEHFKAARKGAITTLIEITKRKLSESRSLGSSEGDFCDKQKKESQQ